VGRRSRRLGDRLHFEIDGSPGAGFFRTVIGSGRFDPDAPEDTRLDIRIPAKGLDLGDAMATSYALSGEWFDAAAHPVLIYRLARLTPLEGEDRWEALGDITIKGRTVIVRTPITLTVGAERAEARGSVEFDRLDFGLGGGLSELVVDIGREVSVAFDLVARPAGAPR
jgi:Uncharacterized conserved protein